MNKLRRRKIFVQAQYYYAVIMVMGSAVNQFTGDHAAAMAYLGIAIGVIANYRMDKKDLEEKAKNGRQEVESSSARTPSEVPCHPSR